MLYYLPQPRYAERWTEYISGENGVFEEALKEWNIPFRAIRPSNELHRISHGVVLDVDVMSRWGFAQSYTMVKDIMDGKVQEGDIIHFEDFWHPGMEMIPYALSLKGLYKKVTLSACCFAQSVDPNDFTAKFMMPWIREFEIAWEQCLDFIFCASEDLVELMKNGWMNDSKRYKATGLMFSSEHLWKHYNPLEGLKTKHRLRSVVYSSRLDGEKDPQFLIDVIKATYKLDPSIMFTICSSYEELRGSSEALEFFSKAGYNYILLLGLTKKEYYKQLCLAAVQFNTAIQDFVSNTLLEATTFGCTPFYPISVASFPPALGYSEELLYDKTLGPEHCAQRVVRLVTKHEGKVIQFSNKDLRWVYKKYDASVYRMLAHLGFKDAEGFVPFDLEYSLKRSQKDAALYDLISTKERV